ncbi:MAG: type II secretion system F family protein [Egibacteraceae bacterium]
MSVRMDTCVLAGLRAALSAGASPATALAECAGDGILAPLARAARLGQPLAEAAGDIDTGDPAADLLVRALGVAERAGAGALTGVEQAFDSIREAAALRRLLQARTAQARGTALVLAVLPFLLWVLLVLFDPRALRFYTTTPGMVTGGLAVALALAGQRWSRRIVEAAGRAASDADPLAGDSRDGGAAEAIELVAVALAGGLPPARAVATVAPLAPPAARTALAAAERRLSGGWDADAAFADSGLASLGAVLAAVERWGAPAGPALRQLAADLRADTRAAVEEAAAKVELRLVFPTTLLTLPAFVLGVVPPLLWAALAGVGGLGPPT